MRFFRLVMIVLLKICTTDKIFGKISLKTIRDTFFSNMWSAISGGTGGLKVLVGGDIQQKGKLQTCGLAGRPPTRFPPLCGTSWSPHKENPEEGAWSVYCNDFEKSEWDYLLSKQQIYNM